MNGTLPDSFWMSYGYVLAQRLRTIRVMRGVSQRRLAELSGISRSLISNLERNHYNCARSADPTLSTLYRIAHALHVPPAVFLPSGGLNVSKHCGDDPKAFPSLGVPWPVEKADTARFHESYLQSGPVQTSPPFEAGC
ncbi:helix-turn-helix domain-containing protein [Corynebacterium mayonis]|uniref:helix-turn-helix domain-containing protein n=1 Tax=Corynebacterium mayonis TaxID=3062461 RepID=UPI003140B116